MSTTTQPWPSIFRFTPLQNHKNAVRGVKFQTDDDVISAVITWLHDQDKELYRQDTDARVSRWRKAVEVGGDFVEK
jgi:23S rRNA maturation mini-RNase III